MRRPDIITAALFVLYCVSSCVDETECGTVSAALDIKATIHSTIIAKQAFIPEDCIGIYLVSYLNGVPGILGDINQTTVVNAEYTYDNSGYWYSADGTDIFLDEQPSDLYTYHPYDEGLSREPGKTNLAAYPFEIEANQQTSRGVLSDFLWAKVPGLSATNFSAPIVFQHLMCRCEINIRLADGVVITENPELWVHNTRTSCTINLSNGQVTPGAETAIITPALNAVTTPGFDYTYDAIIVPQSVVSGTPLFTINLDGDDYMYALPADLTMLSQECYKFNLVAGPSPAQSRTITIEHTPGYE